MNAHEGVSRTRAGRLLRTNAMRPLNWFIGIAQTLLSGGLFAYPDFWVKIFCAVLIVCLLIFYGAVYVYFMVKNPDRLQSEQYNLEAKEISLRTTTREVFLPDAKDIPVASTASTDPAAKI
jgi:hypothetical protein